MARKKLESTALFRTLSDEEKIGLLNQRAEEYEKKVVTLRLTAKARRILDTEARDLGIKRTQFLEILLRWYVKQK